MERKLRIAQYGCGKMSVYTMRYAMEKGAEIVCAFGRSPHNIGKDIGEIAGVGKTGVLATGRAPSLKEALDILLSRATVPLESKVDPSKIRPADPPVLQGSAAKLESLTGWRPKRRLEDTLAEVLDYWRAAG